MCSADTVAGAGRYAPSPSGDLHLGNLRTALLAWLFARTTRRQFFLRIEDLDRARDTGSAKRQLVDLESLGLDWDGEVIVQSGRSDVYRSIIAELESRGLVYECMCTRRDILAAPSAPHTPPGAYPGTCRDLSERERDDARQRIAPRAPALRLRVPEAVREADFAFMDVLLGQVSGVVDDMVLRRGDGVIAYNLAVIVDDAFAGIDQVVRGDDLASSTPRQIMLQRLLGYPTPEYAHVPLVLGPQGKRLAKRDGAVTLLELDKAGSSPKEVLGSLAQSLGLARPGERVTAAALRQRFDPDLLPRTPWVWTEESSAPPRGLSV